MGKKSLVGRICGTVKFLAQSGMLKEEKQMRAVTMKMKLQKEAKQRFKTLIPDSRDKVIHIETSKYVIFKEKEVGALGGQARYFALRPINVHENSSYVNKSFAVDKLLAAAAPKH